MDPPTTTFLNRFIVIITSTPLDTSSGRRKRQAGSTREIPVAAGQNSLPIDTAPFSNLTVGVDAVFIPDGSPEIRVQLVPPTSFSSPEGSE
jgi:hypothetical protein